MLYWERHLLQIIDLWGCRIHGQLTCPEPGSVNSPSVATKSHFQAVLCTVPSTEASLKHRWKQEISVVSFVFQRSHKSSSLNINAAHGRIWRQRHTRRLLSSILPSFPRKIIMHTVGIKYFSAYKPGEVCLWLAHTLHWTRHLWARAFRFHGIQLHSMISVRSHSKSCKRRWRKPSRREVDSLAILLLPTSNFLSYDIKSFEHFVSSCRYLLSVILKLI